MGLMAGKQGLIMGVANDRSLAWGIAKAVHAQGARLAFTYQGEALGRRVRPLADSLDSDFVVEADVTSEASLDALFAGDRRALGPARFRRARDRLLGQERADREIPQHDAGPISCARSIFRAFRSPISAAAPRR